MYIVFFVSLDNTVVILHNRIYEIVMVRTLDLGGETYGD